MKLLILTLFMSTAVALQKHNTVKPFHWLIGTWKQDGKEAFEKWQAGNDTAMAGIAYYYEQEGEGDDAEMEIMLSETIRLMARGKKYFYIPRVHNQNNGNEAEFEIVSFTKKSFVAENPNHEFPQRIVYELKDKTHLVAYIEGNHNGKNKKISFSFTKVE